MELSEHDQKLNDKLVELYDKAWKLLVKDN